MSHDVKTQNRFSNTKKWKESQMEPPKYSDVNSHASWLARLCVNLRWTPKGAKGEGTL